MNYTQCPGWIWRHFRLEKKPLYLGNGTRWSKLLWNTIRKSMSPFQNPYESVWITHSAPYRMIYVGTVFFYLKFTIFSSSHLAIPASPCAIIALPYSHLLLPLVGYCHSSPPSQSLSMHFPFFDWVAGHVCVCVCVSVWTDCFNCLHLFP